MPLPQIPNNIKYAADIIKVDLLNGPTYTIFDLESDEILDHCYTIDFNVDNYDQPHTVENSYTGRTGQMLRNFIDELPTIYYLVDEDVYTDVEPEGYCEDCPECDGTGEDEDGDDCSYCCGECTYWVEPPDYVTLSNTKLVNLLFGPVIAREFQ